MRDADTLRNTQIRGLLRHAKAAEADAVKYRADPNGAFMARLRERDAETLHRIAWDLAHV